MKHSILWRGLYIGLGALVLELILWFGAARDNLYGHPWPTLVLNQLETVEEEYIPTCISVEPALFSLSPPRLREEVRKALTDRGISFRVAPPTHNPPTGYMDRECVEFFTPPYELRGRNLPLLAQPNIAYYGYDFNGDAVLMLQVGTTWIYLHHWSQWI